ncbi:MAG TPA: RNA polymerase sigma-70 factor [Chitinophagaceae bacterium]|nr:RNA polymerase sigma-70 factor [Chitinophagaceae bacterium]
MSYPALHNERELLLRITQDDEKAFEIVVEHYWQRIYNVSLTFIKSTQAAEDIVQDVFLKLWEKRDRLSGVDNFGSWLFIMARNTIISSLRKKSPMIPVGELPVNEAQDSHSEPDELLRIKQLQDLLAEGVKHLPDQQRRIYMLSRVDGLSHEEICNQLGLARSSVKNSLVKALNFLRQYLRENSDPQILLLAVLLMYL